MNTRTRWLVPFLSASLLFSASAAALAHKGKGGGKKPRGVVTSFDAESLALEVELRNGDVFEGTVDPDVQVKLEHRGDHSRSGNPSRGSMEDIVPGAMVLRMKVDDEGVVDKIRLRPEKKDPCAPDEGEGDEPVTEEPVGEEPVVEEPDDGTPTDPAARRPVDEDGSEEECDESDAEDDESDDEVEDEPGDDTGDESGDDSGDGVEDGGVQ